MWKWIKSLVYTPVIYWHVPITSADQCVNVTMCSYDTIAHHVDVPVKQLRKLVMGFNGRVDIYHKD